MVRYLSRLYSKMELTPFQTFLLSSLIYWNFWPIGYIIAPLMVILAADADRLKE